MLRRNAALHGTAPAIHWKEGDNWELLNWADYRIGSQGRSEAKRLVLGSTADELTRGGQIPVLVVRPTTAEAYAEL